LSLGDGFPDRTRLRAMLVSIEAFMQRNICANRNGRSHVLGATALPWLVLLRMPCLRACSVFKAKPARKVIKGHPVKAAKDAVA